MGQVRSYARGPERKQITAHVHYELLLEPILRQLERDIYEAAGIEDERGIVFAEFPELKGFPADGGLM